MTDNVKPFNVIKSGPQVNTDLVQMLEGLTEMARKGEICGFAYTRITPDGVLGSGWGGGSRAELVAGVALLQFQYLAHMCESPE